MPKRSTTENTIISHDGTEIYYRVIKNPNAKGMPILLNDGLACDGYIWKYVIKNFYEDHPIIHWNYRGHGNSSVPGNLDSMGMDAVQKDLQFLLDHLEIKKAIFCGHSMGVQVVLEAYKKLKSKMAGLILLCGGPEYPLSTWHAPFSRNGIELPVISKMRNFMRSGAQTIIKFPELVHPVWKKAFKTEIAYHFIHKFELNPKRVRKADFMPYMDHLSKMDPRAYAKMFGSLIDHSAAPLLNKITKPTLIISGGKDTFAPSWVGEDMN